MRINKFIALNGIAGRRKADKLILDGNVKVNGKPMREPGYDVQPTDQVQVNGKLLNMGEKKEYYLLNKPLGVITSMKDEYERPTVCDLMKETGKRIFPVGRLDYNTSGAIIMTNDGDIANIIMHPKQEVLKTYMAVVSGVISKEKLWKLRNGVDIGGYVTKPCRVTLIKEKRGQSLVEISISEGKNRQVRKMFKAVGNPVQQLERISIGEIRLGHLRVGTYRKLTPKEMEYLKGLEQKSQGK